MSEEASDMGDELASTSRTEKNSSDPRRPMSRLIPVAYEVGGRRVSEPTGSDRDSSLRISKAPGKCCSCREAQIATGEYRRVKACAPVGICLSPRLIAHPCPCHMPVLVSPATIGRALHAL